MKTFWTSLKALIDEVVGVNDYRRWKQQPHAEAPIEDGASEVISTPIHPPMRQRHFGALAFFGYLSALLAPVVGVIFVAIMLIRGETRHGGGVLLVCIVSLVVRLAVLAPAGATAAPSKSELEVAKPTVVTIPFAKRNIRDEEPWAIFKGCHRLSPRRVRCLVGVPAIVVTEEPGNPELEVSEGHVLYWVYDVQQRWMRSWMTKASARELADPEFDPFD